MLCLSRMGYTSEWLKSLYVRFRRWFQCFPLDRLVAGFWDVTECILVEGCRSCGPSVWKRSDTSCLNGERSWSLHLSDPCLWQQFFSRIFVSLFLLACCWYTHVPSSLCVGRNARFVLELHSDMRLSGAVKCSNDNSHRWTVPWSCVAGTPVTNSTSIATLWTQEVKIVDYLSQTSLRIGRTIWNEEIPPLKCGFCSCLLRCGDRCV